MNLSRMAKYSVDSLMGTLYVAGWAIWLVSFSRCQAPGAYFSGEVRGFQRDSVYLFRWDAGRWQRVSSAAVRDGRFAFEGSLSAAGFYWWGLSPQEGDLIYLSPKERPIIQAEVQQLFQNYQIQKGEEAAALLRFRREGANFLQRLQKNPSDSIAQRGLDSLITAAKKSKSEILSLYAPFYRVPSLPVTALRWEDLERLFWEGIALQDGRLGGLPDLFGRFQYFWQVALSMMPEDTVLGRLDGWKRLGKASPGVRKNALVALLVVAQQSGRSDLLLSVAERFVKAFPDDDRKGQLEALLQAEGALRKGQPAPDIELPGPDGQTYRLSSFRGKWVLIDFWASWCRPCRMENPNVVRLYQKYHPKGFEIFGVSLDYQREAWLQAIRQDNLTWVHVSDLKGWQSAGAQLYRVNGIPFTVLVDPEGRIAAKGLRGTSLEAKLREIYGE
jgi:peroxiredoxin